MNWAAVAFSAPAGPGTRLTRPRPSLRARRPGPSGRPKKKSVNPSLFTSATATLRKPPAAASPVRAAASWNVPSRMFWKSCGAPSSRSTSRSTSRRLSKSVGTTATACTGDEATPAWALTSLKWPPPSFWSRRVVAPGNPSGKDAPPGGAAAGSARPARTMSRSPSWSASTKAAETEEEQVGTLVVVVIPRHRARRALLRVEPPGGGDIDEAALLVVVEPLALRARRVDVERAIAVEVDERHRARQRRPRVGRRSEPASEGGRDRFPAHGRRFASA